VAALVADEAQDTEERGIVKKINRRQQSKFEDRNQKNAKLPRTLLRIQKN
jgi:hypothetical protein